MSALQRAHEVRRHRKLTPRMVLETARRLFREDGYRATTLERIASELGVTRAAIYHWFPSKEALLCEIHDEAMDLLVERYAAIERSDQPPLRKLSDALRNHVLTVAENLDTIAVFFQDEASLPEEPARRIADRKRDYDHSLRALVTAAQARGEIRADLDPRVVVESLVSMCNWLYHWYDPNGTVTPEQLADQQVEIALRGITA